MIKIRIPWHWRISPGYWRRRIIRTREMRKQRAEMAEKFAPVVEEYWREEGPRAAAAANPLLYALMSGETKFHKSEKITGTKFEIPFRFDPPPRKPWRQRFREFFW